MPLTKDTKSQEKVKPAVVESAQYENETREGLKPEPPRNQQEPLAYRNKDGTIKVYEEGKAPFVWVRDSSATKSKAERDSKSPTASLSSQLSRTGESYTEYPKPDRDAFTGEEVVAPVSPVPHIALPGKRRQDIMPDDMTFRDIDEHAIGAPSFIKEDLAKLVEYLTSVARTPVEQVRAFFMWITHNINYDTAGYFGRAPLQQTDAESVLKTRLTVCEGYCKLFEAFCREADIPVKTISGYAKAFGCKPEEDITKDIHNAHAWNAVFLDGGWFLLDVTWGAGFVKTKEKKYVPKFNNAYFLTDPVVFLTDHFPASVNVYANCESGKEWQLVVDKISREDFLKIVNFDKHGKEWGIKPVTHTKSIIHNIEYELDVVLRATYTEMLDFIAFMYEDDRKLDQFTYTYMLNEEKVNVHVCLPTTGVFALQIYGRRKKDGRSADYQPIVKYVLQCVKAYEAPVPYPAYHTVYGPVSDLKNYGVSDVGATFQEAEEGEIILSVKPTRYVDILPKLKFGNHNIDLKENCFVDYSDCFQFINIILRLRYEGYYRLELLSKPEKSNQFSPFVAYLIKCKKACTDGVFPVSKEYALKYKCCILEPLTKHLPPKSDIFVCVKSQVATKIKCNECDLEKVDDITFEGTIKTPAEDCPFSVDGCDMDGVYHTLYTYNTVIPTEM
ncbi:hillarin-like [Mercenaria mercenaria]|uniref:hillarin-like n=1 Tax=Mercenaria mercenaria TaxID=6596 RepID=UPI00234EC86E|nr:hillarin-like [Mercenaria mercenaria]